MGRNRKDNLVNNQPSRLRAIWLENTQTYSTHDLDTQFKVVMLSVVLKWKEGWADF